MSAPTITTDELFTQLERAGHSVAGSGEGARTTDVWPAAEGPEREGTLADATGVCGVIALVLDLGYPSDWRILWDIATQVSQGFSDFLVADPECREVYRLHHHDKVVVSVPDAATRRELTDDLTARPDLIEDCSGYVSSWEIAVG